MGIAYAAPVPATRKMGRSPPGGCHDRSYGGRLRRRCILRGSAHQVADHKLFPLLFIPGAGRCLFDRHRHCSPGTWHGRKKVTCRLNRLKRQQPKAAAASVHDWTSGEMACGHGSFMRLIALFCLQHPGGPSHHRSRRQNCKALFGTGIYSGGCRRFYERCWKGRNRQILGYHRQGQGLHDECFCRGPLHVRTACSYCGQVALYGVYSLYDRLLGLRRRSCSDALIHS